jgi:hypothetical protein
MPQRAANEYLKARKNTPIMKSMLLVVVSIMMASVNAVTSSSDQGCASLTFMPSSLAFTGARDMANSPLDVHTFNKFYTF